MQQGRPRARRALFRPKGAYLPAAGAPRSAAGRTYVPLMYIAATGRGQATAGSVGAPSSLLSRPTFLFLSSAPHLRRPYSLSSPSRLMRSSNNAVFDIRCYIPCSPRHKSGKKKVTMGADGDAAAAAGDAPVAGDGAQHSEKHSHGHGHGHAHAHGHQRSDGAAGAGENGAHAPDHPAASPSSSQDGDGHQDGHGAASDDDDAPRGLVRSKSGGILRQQSLYRPDPVTGLVPQKSGRRIVVVDPPAEEDDGKSGRRRKKIGTHTGCCGCFG